MAIEVKHGAPGTAISGSFVAGQQMAQKEQQQEQFSAINKRIEMEKSSQLRRDDVDYEISAKQRAEFNKYSQAYEDAVSSGDYTPDELSEMKRQIDAKQMGIKPVARMKSKSPYPEGQGIGDMWTSEDGYNLIGRKPDGTPYSIGKTNKMTPNDYLQFEQHATKRFTDAEGNVDHKAIDKYMVDKFNGEAPGYPKASAGEKGEIVRDAADNVRDLFGGGASAPEAGTQDTVGEAGRAAIDIVGSLFGDDKERMSIADDVERNFDDPSDMSPEMQEYRRRLSEYETWHSENPEPDRVFRLTPLDDITNKEREETWQKKHDELLGAVEEQIGNIRSQPGRVQKKKKEYKDSPRFKQKREKYLSNILGENKDITDTKIRSGLIPVQKIKHEEVYSVSDALYQIAREKKALKDWQENNPRPSKYDKTSLEKWKKNVKLLSDSIKKYEERRDKLQLIADSLEAELY